MNKMKMLLSLAGALAASQTARTFSRWEVPNVLHALGLERERSRTWENLGLVALGAAAGAGVALLLAPTTGRETREIVGKKLAELGSAASEAAMELGGEMFSASSRTDGDGPPSTASNAHAAGA